MAKVSMQARARECRAVEAEIEAADGDVDDLASKRDAAAYARLLAATPVTVDDALARIEEIARRGALPMEEGEVIAADVAFLRQNITDAAASPDLEAFAALVGENLRAGRDVATVVAKANAAADTDAFVFTADADGARVELPGVYGARELDGEDIPAEAREIAARFGLQFWSRHKQAARDASWAAERPIMRDSVRLARRLRANLAALSLDCGEDTRADHDELTKALLLLEASVTNQIGEEGDDDE